VGWRRQRLVVRPLPVAGNTALKVDEWESF
jgi:hypothetical protein